MTLLLAGWSWAEVAALVLVLAYVTALATVIVLDLPQMGAADEDGDGA